ncbi:CRISPR-associated helicase Cas3' [Selenomonas montiformis]|uniref:CRISPR-associated helicase Cas3' n=1 Tax=Selenomonas montiformis TaxID=2652285 RepID=UPI003F8C4CDC
MKPDNVTLSLPARALWGKLALDGTHRWLPLWLHLADAAEIADLLWVHWLPPHTKEVVVRGIEFPEFAASAERENLARQVVRFLAAAHDCGKASPAFVIKAQQVGFGDVVDEITSKGLPIEAQNRAVGKRFSHALVGECILERYGVDRSLADIVGAHHGKPLDFKRDLEAAPEYSSITGIKNEAWGNVQKELVQYALHLAGLTSISGVTLSVPVQVVLSGMLIMADWLSSDENRFPLISRDYGIVAEESAESRANRAWSSLRLPEYKQFASACPWSQLYAERFGRQPRPVQIHALRVASQMEHPGLMVIEAPMGEGKTEAALAAAEAFARRFGLGGVYFALPTQATSDGIFPRIEKWIEHLHAGVSRSIFLAHGKSGFNEVYNGIKLKSHLYDEEDDDEKQADVVVNDWTQGRKKGLLADFVVGTIDHVLMGGLKMKHLSLRHLGLVNKVVILDECHAYDAYMNQYLDLVLSWLGAYDVPVIVLSATLPPHRRQELLAAYQNRKIKKTVNITTDSVSPYPLISYTDGENVYQDLPESSGRKRVVHLAQLDEDNLGNILSELLDEGGCAGIICNTVKKAQSVAQCMEMYFGEDCVRLLHSCFLSFDRARKEQEVRDLLGPQEDHRPERLIVVGTQVMEQSLDIDFDVLFTEICPMDLLLQRIGRLHRHNRKKERPRRLQEATCYVMGIQDGLIFDKGSTAVYGEYLLMKTRAFLEQRLILPDDIPRLVQQVYEAGYDDTIINRLAKEADISAVREQYAMARDKYKTCIEKKRSKARTFQIKTPKAQRKNLLGWLNAPQTEDASGKRGEATVRDSGNSLTVLVICKKEDGGLYTLPWLPGHGDERIDDVPDDALAKAIASCSINLPSYFVQNWQIDKVIDELEQIVLDNHLDDWYASHWLKGELFLVLNEDHEMHLLDRILVYDEKNGLWSYKEE